MCNRFRVICSAILIARLSNRKLYHSWSKERSHEADISIIQHMRESTLATFFTEDLVVPFCETDATTAVDEVFSEWGPGEYWYPMQSSAIRRCCWSSELNVERSNADAILDSQADNILLETSLCFVQRKDLRIFGEDYSTILEFIHNGSSAAKGPHQRLELASERGQTVP